STIDRIAANTQFGSKKVLDGTLGATVARTDVANGLIESQLTTGLGNVSLADGNYKIKITTAFVAAAPAVKATSASTITVTAGAAATFFKDTTGGAGADVDADTGVLSATFFKESEIGRASCRERVEKWGRGGAVR